MNIKNVSMTGIYAGAGMVVLPAAATALVASSKIISYNVIFNVVIRILTFNHFQGIMNGVSFVAVPLLWKLSRISAMVGGILLAISAIALVANSVYQRHFEKNES